MGYVHIHAPQPTMQNIRSGECHDCKGRSHFVNFFTPWYGWDSTCLRCGRHWQDGEWIPLPFERAARAKSIARAKARYRRHAVARERSEHLSPRQVVQPIREAQSSNPNPSRKEN